MPRVVPIRVFNIAKTQVNFAETRYWLQHLDVSEETIDALLNQHSISSPALLIALAAKRCYMSFEVGLNANVTKIREDMVAYLDNVIKSRHGSVLEHSVYTFSVEGVSRVFTAEMNRHRAGWAISEGSLRFIRFDQEIPYWQPTSITTTGTDDFDLSERKAKTRAIFHNAFRHQEMMYAELLEVWGMDESDKNFAYKKAVTSCLRRIVGMGVATGGVWSGNIRALRHVIAARTDEAAEEEILYVFQQIGMHMIKNEPLLFADFTARGKSLVPGTWKV
jgi:thymidylate synthase (FAD)